MSDALPGDPEAIVRGGRTGGGRGPIPGGSTLPGAFGFGSGGIFGGSDTFSTGSDAALKALLRKRLALPTAQPSYLTQDVGSASADANNSMFGGDIIRILQKQGKIPANWQGGGGGGNTGGTGPSEWWPEGANPSGDPTITLNPWSGTGWDQSRTLNRLYDLLNQFDKSGAFSPTGNSALMDATRGEALSNAEALRQRNALIGRNLGVDPSTGASYALQSDLNTQGGVADAVNSAVLGRLQSQEQFGRDLLSMLGGLNAQDWMAERQGDISKRYAPDQGGGWGSTLGSISGGALGSYFGPWGSAVGSRLGSRLGGRN